MSCSDNEERVAVKEDYNAYLLKTTHESADEALEEISFWETKLEKAPNQISWLGKLATAYTQAFNATGKIDYLINAEANLVNANHRTKYENAGFLRALARNYISQHRFKEALDLLKKAKLLAEDLNSTHKMLFDVYLELGRTEEAYNMLESFKKHADFDYYIRLAKWNDNQGNLADAIFTLEKASRIAAGKKNRYLKEWSYTNLADFYGHAGKIDKAYRHYLKALKLNPDNMYALKGIAWIVYSNDNEPEEALRILNNIQKKYNSPDLHLFKSEIATSLNKLDLKSKFEKDYFEMIAGGAYGEMYNSYNVLLLSEKEERLWRAMQLAQKEVSNRPTPESYDLLAWAHFQQGNINEAQAIIEYKVFNKTSEPRVLYHMATIFKATGQVERAKSIKQELKDSYFELGPLLKKNIEKL